VSHPPPPARRSAAEVCFAGQTFVLLAERAMLWPAGRTLVVADAHLGKAELFQARGLRVPSGANEADLRRLSDLLDAHAAAAGRLLILGDLLHGRESGDDPGTLASLRRWRGRHAGLAVTLVRGNHDRHAGDPPADLGFDCVGELTEAGVEWTHAPHPLDGPVPPDALPRVAGHLHPAYRLTDPAGGGGGGGASVPCFVVDPRQLVLPSFGTFTGGARVGQSTGRSIYVAAAGRVVRAAGGK